MEFVGGGGRGELGFFGFRCAFFTLLLIKTTQQFDIEGKCILFVVRPKFEAKLSLIFRRKSH